MSRSIKTGNLLGLGAILLTAQILGGCIGGGGSSSSGSSTTAPTAAEVAAITPTQIASYSSDQIIALGANFKYLSNASLNALTISTDTTHPTGQIQSITAAQIATLSTAQVRMIGAAGPGGSVTTSLIKYLNSGAWSALVSDSAQVSAITPAEIATLTADEIVAMDTNIKYLSNAALGALYYSTSAPAIPVGQVQSLTVTQIGALTPTQVRLIGSTGEGGATFTSQIRYLNSGAWGALASDPLQVAAITATEIPTLPAEKIITLDTNTKYLSDAALGALVPGTTCSGTCPSQVASITAAQIMALTPSQISVIAGIDSGQGNGNGIVALNLGAFSSLSASQVAVLTPANMVSVSDAQLASLSTTAIAGFTPATIASFTVAQKASLSSAQHTACGC